MTMTGKLRRSIHALVHKQEVDALMDEEMRSHIEMQVHANVEAGMEPEAARYAAMRQFGRVESIKEVCRDQRGLRWLEDLGKDIRYGARQLRRSPVFSFVAVLSLSLSIGAGTTVFSLVNGILLRSLPVPNPHLLRVLQWSGAEPRVGSHSGQVTRAGNRLTGSSVSHPSFLSLREKGSNQADIFGFCPLEEIVSRARNEAFTAKGMMVSDNFFSALGVRALLGRTLSAGEGHAGDATRVVITYNWWERHFAFDPEVIGQGVTLNGASFTIVGVLPRGFSGVQSGDQSDFYVPMSAVSPFLRKPLSDANNWFVRLMARLRPGVGDSRFRAVLDVAFAHEASEIMKEPRILLEPGRGGLTYDRNNYRKPLLLMLGGVGLVMLVACANLAGLSLARGTTRQHELAVRAALGAGRWRLVRQSLVESLMLALLGGGIGVLLAVWGIAALAPLLAGSDGLHNLDRLRYDFSLDVTVLWFTIGTTLITALLSGFLPALRASRVDPLGGLKCRSAVGTPRLRIGRLLVASQICVSLILLIGAGLYVRTLSNLVHIDAGFSTERLLLFQLSPGAAGYREAQLVEFYERVQNSLSAIPGVSSAALLHNPLIANRYDYGGFTLPGLPAKLTEDTAYRLVVSETFLTTMGIPLLRGRGLRTTDTERAPRVVVVNEAFVGEYLRDGDPIGRKVNFWGADWQIVGVCHNAKYKSIREPAPPTLYASFRQYSRGDTHCAVRTALPPLLLASSVQKAVAAIDPSVPLANMATQEEVRDGVISPERAMAALSAALGGLALLLSCIGLYGLMAYDVGRRTREIALRMALGATRPDIAIPVLREALLLAILGVGVGVPAALAVTCLIRSQLYGVAATDPVTFMGASVLLISVAVLAAWFPAHQATRVAPMTVLKAD